MLFRSLSAELPSRIKLLRVYPPDRKFSDITSARYTVVIERSGLCGALEGALSNPLITVKKTKSGEKEIDLIPRIKEYGVSESDDGKTILSLTLCASGEEYLNPDLLIKALTEKGVLGEDDVSFVSRDEIVFG